MTKPKRVNIDVVTVELVEQLMNYAGVKKTNEVINNSISLLHWAVKQSLEGKKIASYHLDSRELELFSMPILDRISITKNKVSPPRKTNDLE